jgi:hypothetical protein
MRLMKVVKGGFAVEGCSHIEKRLGRDRACRPDQQGFAPRRLRRASVGRSFGLPSV